MKIVLSDCFEFIVNEKVVYSKRLLHKDPDPEELMNIALQLDKVSTTTSEIEESG